MRRRRRREFVLGNFKRCGKWDFVQRKSRGWHFRSRLEFRVENLLSQRMKDPGMPSQKLFRRVLHSFVTSHSFSRRNIFGDAKFGLLSFKRIWYWRDLAFILRENVKSTTDYKSFSKMMWMIKTLYSKCLGGEHAGTSSAWRLSDRRLSISLFIPSKHSDVSNEKHFFFRISTINHEVCQAVWWNKTGSTNWCILGSC